MNAHRCWIQPGEAGRALCLLSLSAALLGCEAELRLEGIDATLAEPVLRTDQFLAVARSGPDSVVALADNGVVLHGTESEGLIAWERRILSPSQPDLPRPTFLASTECANGTVFALSFENEVWHLAAGGWEGQLVETEEQLQDIACAPDGALWVSGAFGTLLSRDTTESEWSDHSFYDDFTLTALTFIPGTQTGFAVGEFGSLAKTVDGGASWALLDPITDDFYPLDVHFANAESGWVSGVLGVIYATKDGGASWSKEPTAAEAAIYGFTSAQGRTLAFGDLGTLMEYQSETAQWVTHPSPETPIHFAAATPSGDGLLVAGGWGLLHHLPLQASTTVTDSADRGEAL